MNASIILECCPLICEEVAADFIEVDGAVAHTNSRAFYIKNTVIEYTINMKKGKSRVACTVDNRRRV